jgi:hypothetical protein
LPLTAFLVFLNRRPTKDPHPPSSHSPVGVAGDFWLGSRFRSPTGSTKNCQRTRVVLLFAQIESIEFCGFVSSRKFNAMARIAHARDRILCSTILQTPRPSRPSKNSCGRDAPFAPLDVRDCRKIVCDKLVRNRDGSGFRICESDNGARCAASAAGLRFRRPLSGKYSKSAADFCWRFGPVCLF